MEVPLIDLRAQYDGLRSEIDDALARIVEAQGFVLGPAVEAFEGEMARIVGARHAVGCASGTDALYLPLRALDPNPGDHVLVPAFTFFATAGAAWNAGLVPVFCDIDPVTFNVTADTLDAAWTERTRAVIPVHLFGQMAPMEEIRALAHGRGAFVLEDAAQAIGATRVGAAGVERAGSAGDAAAFSFFPTKNLGAFGDGGLVTTDDEALAERLFKLRVHGGRQMYHHEMVGVNSRLDALQAAVLSAKLPSLEGWTRARRANAERYTRALEDVPELVTPGTLPGNRHVYNQYTIRARRRDSLRTHLADRGIGSGVYYPAPLHLQACFRELGYRPGSLPVAEAACSEVLSLPVFPELGQDRQDRVIDEIRAFYGRT